MTQADLERVYEVRDLIAHRVKDIVDSHLLGFRLSDEQRVKLLQLLNEQFFFT
jgi:hypothetical protein